MILDALTKNEKHAARILGVTAADVHKTGRNYCGDVFALYNRYFLIESTFSGYSRAQIYRVLLRRLIDRCEVYGCLLNRDALDRLNAGCGE